jgi:hypothetical protein
MQSPCNFLVKHYSGEFYVIYEGNVTSVLCEMNLRWSKSIREVDGPSFILIDFNIPALSPRLSSTQSPLKLQSQSHFSADSMSWCRARFVDVRPDIASFSRVWFWNLLSCLWCALSDERPDLPFVSHSLVICLCVCTFTVNIFVFHIFIVYNTLCNTYNICFIYNVNQQSEFTFYKLMLWLWQCLDGQSSSGKSPVPQIRSIGQFLLSRLFCSRNSRFWGAGFLGFRV